MKGHTHPCQHCKTPVDCQGLYVRNYDGFPDAICTAYHLAGGTTAHVLCESCVKEVQS